MINEVLMVCAKMGFGSMYLAPLGDTFQEWYWTHLQTHCALINVISVYKVLLKNIIANGSILECTLDFFGLSMFYLQSENYLIIR